jgi:hypothetical protein
MILSEILWDGATRSGDWARLGTDLGNDLRNFKAECTPAEHTAEHRAIFAEVPAANISQNPYLIVRSPPRYSPRC